MPQKRKKDTSFGSNTVGAAESNPNSFDAMLNRYGAIEPGENPARDISNGVIPKMGGKESKLSSNTYNYVFEAAERTIDGLTPADMTYNPIAEKESISRAINRLNSDYEGEKAKLEGIPAWGGEDVDAAMGILGKLRNEARSSNDHAEVARWAKMLQKKSHAGRSNDTSLR